MKLFGIRNVAMVGALGVAGLGLIGLGAHATFTQTAYTQQQITAGTMNAELSSSGGTWSSPTLTMANVGPVGSNFTTGDQQVIITNNGNIAITGVTLTFSDPSANATFDSEAQICLYKGGALYNNSFDAFTGSVNIPLSIAPGNTDSFYVNVYAGSGFATPACGNDGAGSLTNGALGGVVNPTLTAVFSG
jgi:predicted ribosomally synthesized peptide with SipW-like signal peptide